MTSERIIKFEEWRDNSMGRNTLRLKVKFEGFNFQESRLVSEAAVVLAYKLADELENNLKDCE